MTIDGRRKRTHRLAAHAAALCLTVAGPAAAAEDAAPEANDPACVPRSHRLYAVADLGFLMPVGLGMLFSVRYQGRPRWDVDFIWEPSNYLQSYSVGGAYHPWDRAFFIGARARWMQLHSPFSRGFHARRDNQPALGPELGVRLPFGRDLGLMPFASLGAIFFPSATTSLPPMYSLNVGVGLGL